MSKIFGSKDWMVSLGSFVELLSSGVYTLQEAQCSQCGMQGSSTSQPKIDANYNTRLGQQYLVWTWQNRGTNILRQRCMKTKLRGSVISETNHKAKARDRIEMEASRARWQHSVLIVQCAITQLDNEPACFLPIYDHWHKSSVVPHCALFNKNLGTMWECINCRF